MELRGGATRPVPGTASSFPQSFVLGVGMEESVVNVHFTMKGREEQYTDSDVIIGRLCDLSL